VTVARTRGRIDARCLLLGTALSLLVSCAPARAQALRDTVAAADSVASADTIAANNTAAAADTVAEIAFGVEVGLNFTNLDGLGDSDRLNRAALGVFGDWRFSKHVHFGIALLPFAGRGAEGLAPAPTGDPAIDSQTAGGTMKRSLNYFEIPLLVRWAPERDLGFRVGAGPSLGIVTSARDRYDCITPSGSHYQIERSITSQLSALDLGFSIEAEWRFTAAAVALRFTQGHTDMSQNGAPQESHSRALTATGRFYLGKTPAP